MFPPMRSIFGGVYRLSAAAMETNRKRVGANLDVSLELFFAALLLPLSRCYLQMPWCERVVAHDAASGGHGLAYTTVPTDEVRRWAR